MSIHSSILIYWQKIIKWWFRICKHLICFSTLVTIRKPLYSNILWLILCLKIFSVLLYNFFMHPQFLTKNNKSWSLKGLKIKNKYHKLSNTIKHKCLVKLDQMLDFSKNQICILKIWLSSHFECIKYFLWPPDII